MTRDRKRLIQAVLAILMVVVGLGMGFSATSFLVAVQSAVGWGERGDHGRVS